jgi:hypothetical protein
VAIAVAFSLVSSSALAAAFRVEGNSATFAWDPSSGPVAYYAVHVQKNGEGFSEEAATYVSEPRVTLYGEYGEKIRVRVRAWGWIGKSVISSRYSHRSIRVRFVNPNKSGKSPQRVEWWPF